MTIDSQIRVPGDGPRRASHVLYGVYTLITAAWTVIAFVVLQAVNRAGVIGPLVLTCLLATCWLLTRVGANRNARRAAGWIGFASSVPTIVIASINVVQSLDGTWNASVFFLSLGLLLGAVPVLVAALTAFVAAARVPAGNSYRSEARNPFE